jgi:hypothetical protein
VVHLCAQMATTALHGSRLPAARHSLQVAEEHYNGRPIPVFGYNRKEGFMDLMFPDFTYFGHEYSQVTGAAPIGALTGEHMHLPIWMRPPLSQTSQIAVEPCAEHSWQGTAWQETVHEA